MTTENNGTNELDQAIIEAAAAATPGTPSTETEEQRLERYKRELIVAEELRNAPYSARELTTATQLLALKIEGMIRDFERQTKATVDHVTRAYADTKLNVHVRIGDMRVYS